MEIYGKKGKLELFGLGGSYGTEKIIWYKMLPEMGPPETICWEFPMGDDSWEFEMNEFYKDILLDREPEAGLADAVAALKIIEKIYMDSAMIIARSPLRISLGGEEPICPLITGRMRDSCLQLQSTNTSM